VPSLNFQPQFVPAVENGIAELEGRPLPNPGVRPKRQTIRALRKVPIKPGDVLHLFTAMRTKRCRKLGLAKCAQVAAFRISVASQCSWNSVHMNLGERTHLAKADGFDDASQMVDWFERVHGLPFRGVVIRW